MPYCVMCGKQVAAADQFCGACGTPQKQQPRGPGSNSWDNLSDQNVMLLCYVPWLGWIASVAVLASGRFRTVDRVRFHAFQGLYLFVAWLLVDWFLTPILRFQGQFFGLALLPRLLSLAVFGAWIYMLIKVHSGEDYRLPVLGELADRSVAERRP